MPNLTPRGLELLRRAKSNPGKGATNATLKCSTCSRRATLGKARKAQNSLECHKKMTVFGAGTAFAFAKELRSLTTNTIP